MPINPNPVNWFEIPCNDIARATTFYESVFGVELAQTEMGGRGRQRNGLLITATWRLTSILRLTLI